MNTEEAEDDKGMFTVYCVVMGDSMANVARRRYSHFREFNDTMVAANPDLKGRFPAFPSKKWFGAMKPSFVLQRSTELEEYLRGLATLFRCDTVRGGAGGDWAEVFPCPHVRLTNPKPRVFTSYHRSCR